MILRLSSQQYKEYTKWPFKIMAFNIVANYIVIIYATAQTFSLFAPFTLMRMHFIFGKVKNLWLIAGDT